MPMHDWTRVEPTIYHHFHQQWCAALAAGFAEPQLPLHQRGTAITALAIFDKERHRIHRGERQCERQ